MGTAARGLRQVKSRAREALAGRLATFAVLRL
jgi:hypothetical protein